MVSFLHVWVLGYFVDAPEFLDREGDAGRYDAMRQNVIETCRRELWDGAWYLRGITADGRKIGTHMDREGRVNLESNPWAWCAEAVLGRGRRAIKFYRALCPAAQNDKIEVRQSEPYSYCQFVMGPDHPAFGRARHPFMTGSGGWSYFAATRYILGVRPQFGGLLIDPCAPSD